MKAVILAGGGGTRLWPLSTHEKPKQFQPLVSTKTMLEETVARLDFLKPEDIYIAINQNHHDLVRKLCPQIPVENLIIEPAMRDTAPCIGLAAALIESRHPGEVMAVIYADHLIQNTKTFRQKLQAAEQLAQYEQTLNIIEVPASEPNTHYGYVKLGDQIAEDLYELDSFTEKPDKATAEQFIASGNYLWNTGIYVWQTRDLLDQYQELQPETYQKLQQIIRADGSQTYDATLNAIYPTIEKISLDYAIMEKIDPKKVRIFKADLGWSDIGTWEAIWQELPKNEHQNIVRGNVHLLDSQNSLVYGDTTRRICLIGVENLIVIDTPQGLLIAQKDQSARIKELGN